MTTQQLIAAIVATFAAPVLLYLGVRFTAKSGVRANADATSAAWERKYRANAEKHLLWDINLLSLVRPMRAALLELLPADHPLRTQLEEPISEPPPLFPDAE